MAQEIDRNVVHWAYSSYFGTGWYTLGEERDAYVFRFKPRWELREASLSDDGERQIGIGFRFPVTAGLDTLGLDNLPGIVDPNNLASLSVTPEIVITAPLSKRWSLRPFAAIGWGSIMNNGESAWTYWAGIKSRYELGSGKLTSAFINSAGYVGHTPDDATSQAFWPVSAGFEFDYQMDKRFIGEQHATLHWHIQYTRFADDLDMVARSGSRLGIPDQWDIGIAVSQREGSIRMGWFNFDRLGLAYRFSSSGDLKGISVVLRSLYDI